MAHFFKRLPAPIHTPRTHRAVSFSSRAAPRMSTPSQQADLPSHPLETSPAQHSNKHHNALPPRTHARGLAGPQRQQRRASLSPHHHHHRRRYISEGTLISCVVLQSPLPPPSNPPPISPQPHTVSRSAAATPLYHALQQPRGPFQTLRKAASDNAGASMNDDDDEEEEAIPGRDVSRRDQGRVGPAWCYLCRRL